MEINLFQGGVDLSRFFKSRIRRVLGLVLFVCLSVAGARSASAAIQFDVFLGFGDGQGGVVRSGNWFPVGVEVHHDGPNFNGVIEITSGSIGNSLMRRVLIELPTNTRKRVVIPVFHSGGNFSRWNVTLRTESGKKIAEHENIGPTETLNWNGMMIGSLARTFQGAPSFPQINEKWRDAKPGVGRIQSAFFPDNPIALTGLNGLYLSSSQALKLSDPQIESLISWLNAGGHLVVALEQASDMGGLPWLSAILPCETKGVRTLSDAGDLEDALLFRPNSVKQDYWKDATDWNQSPSAKMTKDPSFRGKQFTVVECKATGKVLYRLGGLPVVMERGQGRGIVTALAFSPEREPFRSWKNRPWFWATIYKLPPHLLTTREDNYYASSVAMDGIYGYMVDSRQVRKLPVEWLFLLLVGYLLIIGPFDYFLLKKLNRQMLTWITFPTYVVLFSVMIYWIGFALRAGEIEWNEINIVDVFGKGEGAVQKGRTFGSVYSPSNSKYDFLSSQRYASIRGEYSIHGSSGMEGGRSQVTTRGDGFSADIFVPVWTSQMFVTDWWDVGASPIEATVKLEGRKISGTVRNTSSKTMNNVRLFIRTKWYELGEMEAGETETLELELDRGKTIKSLVDSWSSKFTQAAQQREKAFGKQNFNLFSDNGQAASVAAMIQHSGKDRKQVNSGNVTEFGSEQDADLGQLLDRDLALVMAWSEDSRPTPAMNQFEPRRSSSSTLYRVAVPTGE
ncbi:DUF4350 domain-containing protein [Verrucomicrobia bacterium]|nr:DUF4350 domain-containing protein [Verrucomicrobiota bacterium]